MCLLLVPLTVLASLGVPMLRNAIQPPPTEEPQHRVGADTLGVDLIWRSADLVVPNYMTTTALECSDEAIVALAYASASGQRVQAIQPRTGATIWESPTIGSVSGMSLHGDRVYAVMDWRLTSLSVLDGATMWRGDRLPDRTAYRMAALPEGVLMLYSIEERGGPTKFCAIARRQPAACYELRLSRFEERST
jgi:hypothetical protein